jgi:hypothetical protein
MDCDSARATTITEAKIVPEGYEADQAHSLIIASRDPKGLPLDMLSLATFLLDLVRFCARSTSSTTFI